MVVSAICSGSPSTVSDYSEHLFKVCCLLYNGNVSAAQAATLTEKFASLASALPQFVEQKDPANSKLYLVVEKCFDVLIKLSMDLATLELATAAIRFLTAVIMHLNYWEIYNLLRWRPSIYCFLELIKFDLHDCYARFMRDYQRFAFRQRELDDEFYETVSRMERRGPSVSSSPELSPSDDRPSLSYVTREQSDDHDQFVMEQLNETDKEKPYPRDRRKFRVDLKLAAHRVIKKADIKAAPATSRSSNYDPDVVHECQLPSPDEPDKICMRRFSRKYELIRHQETVHLKKKKLFKCFVCVKQDPNIGPRIFTRHDTLAKHIRVNHRILGKEAKAEVAYSKKHAEIVEEGDITVHVGRRKTKVDFELRAHMEHKGASREGALIYDDIDDLPPDSVQSGDEEGSYVE